jgi:hypothetical protein
MSRRAFLHLAVLAATGTAVGDIYAAGYSLG